MAKTQDRNKEKKNIKKSKEIITAEKPNKAETTTKLPNSGFRTTIILPCTCTHQDQDEFYGKNNRLFNIGNNIRRCTVCGNKK